MRDLDWGKECRGLAREESHRLKAVLRTYLTMDLARAIRSKVDVRGSEVQGLSFQTRVRQVWKM